MKSSSLTYDKYINIQYNNHNNNNNNNDKVIINIVNWIPTLLQEKVNLLSSAI
jgi:hypothetical protein